jgi:hypothetical protein
MFCFFFFRFLKGENRMEFKQQTDQIKRRHTNIKGEKTEDMNEI